MNRSNEIPSGSLMPEKPKPSQALLKQSNESIKMAVQNIVPVNEMPILANEVVTVTTNEPNTISQQIAIPPPVITDNGINLNVSNTQEVITSVVNKMPEIQVSQSIPVALPPIITTTPSKIVQPTGQFVQVKPPTTTSGRVQSPNVKNFFIRKGIEKQSTNQISSPTGTFITTPVTSTPQMSISQLPANKKIFIKSQQIIVPAINVKSNTTPIIVSTHQNISTSTSSIPINTTVIDSSSNDLSKILDLPILFADNTEQSNVVDQTAQILNTSSGSTNILLNTSIDRNAQITAQPNIFFSSIDGKLPNRPVVISAAKVTKPIQQNTIATTPTTNKVIFINRNQIKQQIVGSQTVSGAPIVKGLQTLKLVPTSLSNQSTPITLQGNQITKLSPGTKIDLSKLKLVNNASPSISGGIVKPLIINKAVPGAKNAIVIKSPMGTNIQTHQVIKGNVLNRNITVRKVMNVVQGVKPTTSSSIVVSSPTQSTSTSISNITQVSSTKTTRKTRNSN